MNRLQRRARAFRLGIIKWDLHVLAMQQSYERGEDLEPKDVADYLFMARRLVSHSVQLEHINDLRARGDFIHLRQRIESAIESETLIDRDEVFLELGITCGRYSLAIEHSSELASQDVAEATLGETERTAGAYIRANPGCDQKAAAKACGVQSDTFKSHTWPSLKSVGFRLGENKRGCFPPEKTQMLP